MSHHFQEFMSWSSKQKKSWLELPNRLLRSDHAPAPHLALSAVPAQHDNEALWHKITSIWIALQDQEQQLKGQQLSRSVPAKTQDSGCPNPVGVGELFEFVSRNSVWQMTPYLRQVAPSQNRTRYNLKSQLLGLQRQGFSFSLKTVLVGFIVFDSCLSRHAAWQFFVVQHSQSYGWVLETVCKKSFVYIG